jgi:DNA-binding transcriptional MerR regulator
METDEREAFTLEQVLRLTGLSRRRLLYWIERDIISADIEATRPRGPIRLFSFRNLLEVRVAVWLRDKVSLQLIRKILERLRDQGFERPLTTITFGIVESETYEGGQPDYDVALQYPDGSWEQWSTPGQLFMALTVPIQKLAAGLRNGIEEEQRSRRVGCGCRKLDRLTQPDRIRESSRPTGRVSGL